MIESPTTYRVVSLGKLRLQEAWRVELLHSQPRHRLYWITRGQGRVTIRGITRGYGPNTAIFLPAGTQAALELSAQLQGMELGLPIEPALELPTEPFHIRVATPEAQTSLTGHLEKTERELSGQAPAMARALKGYGLLISTWITRELDRTDGAVIRKKSHKLIELYAQAVEAKFRNGLSVADFAAQLGVTPHASVAPVPRGIGQTGPCAVGRTRDARGLPPVARHRHARARGGPDLGLFFGRLFYPRLSPGDRPDAQRIPRGTKATLNEPHNRAANKPDR